MKKFVITALILAFALSIAGCDNKKDGAGESPSPSPTGQASPSPGESPKESAEPSPPGESPKESAESPGESPDGADNQVYDEHSAAAMLDKITAAASDKLPDNTVPMSFGSEIKAEAATGIGLTSEQFGEYAEEGRVSTAALTSSAHEMAVIKCKNEDAAIAVKALIAAGYDPGKWTSVRPGKSAAVEFDVYVLLIASTEAITDAVLEAVKSVSGDTLGEANVFYTHS
ncbi:MAG: hypothetical protein GX823_01875 [Clostridiales bacterium]|nr:hypothetical protein [Clostridiales bacterium]